MFSKELYIEKQEKTMECWSSLTASQQSPSADRPRSEPPISARPEIPLNLPLGSALDVRYDADRFGTGCCNGGDRSVGTADKDSSSNPGIYGGPGRCETEVDQDVIDFVDNKKELAQWMNSMSIADREAMIEDIHGITQTTQETNEFLNAKLKDMQNSIDTIEKKLAYNQSHFLKPSSVKNRGIMLMMLRSCAYDPWQAAKRLVSFCELKLDLFGIDCLANPIRMKDLSPGMIDELYKSKTRVTFRKDRSGRNIVFSLMDFSATKWKSYFGAIYFMFMDILQCDIEAQRKGFVLFIWNSHRPHPRAQFFAVMSKAARFFMSMPIKFSSYHYGFGEKSAQGPAFGAIRAFIGKYARLRMRAHFGSFLECVYSLQTFGITLSALPTDADGNLDVNGWNGYLDAKRMAEQNEPSPNQLTPSSRDVLFGRGFPFQRFVGNIYLAALIEHNRPDYTTMSRKRKAQTIAAIIDYITKVHGGRFLRRIPGSDMLNEDEDLPIWETVTTKEVLNKVGHRFRTPGRSDLLRCQTNGTYEFEGIQITVLEPFAA